MYRHGQTKIGQKLRHVHVQLTKEVIVCFYLLPSSFSDSFLLVICKYLACVIQKPQQLLIARI